MKFAATHCGRVKRSTPALEAVALVLAAAAAAPQNVPFDRLPVLGVER